MTAPPAQDEAPEAPSSAYRLLPVYLVLDTAVSGAGRAAVADVVATVRDGWATNPTLSDKLRLGVVDAGPAAQVRLALCDPLDPDVVPPVLPPGGPPTGAAFGAVRSMIDADVRNLDADGFATHRPLVCLVLGAVPDDSWGAGLTALTTSATAPVVVVCCFGPAGAQAGSLVEPAPDGAVAVVYTADPDLPADAAVGSLAEILTTVIVRTGHSLGPAGSVLLPAADELPRGITEVPGSVSA